MSTVRTSSKGRPVRAFHISESARQLDAGERITWRYVSFYLGALATVAWMLLAHADGAPLEVKLLTSAFLLVLLVVFCQPWHRHLNVDIDAYECVVAWRMFGFLPMGRRRHSLVDQRLTAIRRWTQPAKESSSESLGCLMVLLPFPLNLAGMFTGGSKDAKQSVFHALALRDQTRGDEQVLMLLATPTAADNLLRAMHAMVPDHVVLPAEPATE